MKIEHRALILSPLGYLYHIYPELCYNMTIMSFLFDKRTKKAIKWVWVLVSILIILSMVFVFSGGQGIY